MKTSFQISTQRLSLGSKSAGASSDAVQKNISVSGPHGPVCPAGPHQLSSLPKNAIRSFGMPSDSHTDAASSSFGILFFGSPIKQLTANFSIGIFNSLVRNSKLISIAS